MKVQNTKKRIEKLNQSACFYGRAKVSRLPFYYRQKHSPARSEAYNNVLFKQIFGSNVFSLSTKQQEANKTPNPCP